ncbi:MAG: UvrD-helicase domain-containing protein [Segniliparus sp.]|uniref:UvrD-helicase domain-containing protein n=1 Tax=Segniliparus sp. TaxID=2804064 RepID=UPI003F35AF8A
MTISPRLLAQAIGAPLPSEEQERVIGAPLTSSVVLAGAGSGKTETVAARVVWLVANGLVEPEQVLGLTFTRSAARGMLSRIRLRLAGFAASPLIERADPTGRLGDLLENSEPQVMTYDAYTGELASQWGLLLGGSAAPSADAAAGGRVVLSDAGMWQLAYETVAGWESLLAVDRGLVGAAEAVTALGRRMAEQLAGPERVTDAAEALARLVATLPKGPRQRAEPSLELRDAVAVQQARVELLGVVERIQERLRSSGATDFATQTARAAELAEKFPQVRAEESGARRVVLLDEYQDTGYAQRILLRALFGSGSGVAVTAVGDPHQAIYAWRGASAGNLAAFRTDFDAPDALTLMTSWRNPSSVLRLANLTAAPLRGSGQAVPELTARPEAPDGEVRAALFEDVALERAWIAERLREALDTRDRGAQERATAAVLVRRNADALPIAEALAAAGLEAQVVGLGGLLATPEVSDLVAMLELVADPSSSAAALQVLTSPRWRIGAADLAALAARVGELGPSRQRQQSPTGSAVSQSPTGSAVSQSPTGWDELVAQLAAVLAEDGAEHAGLGDALADLGDPARYSSAGHARLLVLAGELERLRGQLDRPLPEFVTLAERTTGLAVEAGPHTKERLSSFASVVAEHAKGVALIGGRASLSGLVGYLRVAETVERGLPVGETAPDPRKVQVLTVHAAKGLEWDVVAVAHLVKGVFPSGRPRSTWIGDLAELPPDDLGPLTSSQDRAELQEMLRAEREAAKELSGEEERRLGYVAVTRAKRTLLLSGHWWAEGVERPLGPSAFLVEWHDALAAAGMAVRGAPDAWAESPALDAVNPLIGEAEGAVWPADPLLGRRAAVQRGADLVRSALAKGLADETVLADETGLAETGLAETGPDDDSELFEAVAALIAERTVAGSAAERAGLTVSDVVGLVTDPVGFEQERARRGPRPPAPEAQTGVGFHEWVRGWYLSEELLGLDELPGAADDDEVAYEKLRQRFLDSPWAARSPVAVEAPFELNLDGVLVRGRIDAVFAQPGGGFVVVDWKTGRTDPRKARAQLSLYRLAWQRLTGAAKVSGAVHEVASGKTIVFDDLYTAEELAALLR